MVTVFVSRGYQQLANDDAAKLKDLGFPTPERSQEAFPATHRRLGQKQRDPDEIIKKAVVPSPLCHGP